VFEDEALLQAAGRLRAAYEAVDWAATPLGPMSSWSPALRRSLDLTLHTRFPVTLFWGSEFALIYNEAFVSLIADKHPAALGTPAKRVFPEAWDHIGPMLEGVLAGGGATWVEDESVPLVRHGRLEEAYFTFSYSPVTGARGDVEGVLDIAAETTRQVIDRRRLETLSRLRETLADSHDADEARKRALPILRANSFDLPQVDIDLGLAQSRDGVPGGTERRASIGENDAESVARFPLGSTAASGRRPVLMVRLSEQLAPDEDYLGFLRLIAAALGQAIDQIAARDAEREIAATEKKMSEALQRSLLTRPLEPDHLQVAVRYRAAVAQAQVGGDWYDAFLTAAGALTVVVGDVTGHDLRAVAAMAQVRNLLRGVSYATQGSPAEVLFALDRAMHGLAVGLYATAILAQVEQTEPEGERGLRTLRWSNAGHPPPVLLAPDGRARLLEAPPDALLGLGDGERADQTVSLEPGSSVVFYTDGLVERRGTPIQERLDRLIGVLAGRQGCNAEELCDHLLSQLDEAVEDDVALLVLHAYPEGSRRPPEAGPEVLPRDLPAGDAGGAPGAAGSPPAAPPS
jgi:serine phosphatase RsbU (regulator of sigma subunit)